MLKQALPHLYQRGREEAGRAAPPVEQQPQQQQQQEVSRSSRG